MTTQSGSVSPIPLTIVGGYLGAGKTTLANHLLRSAEGVRIAVLVNEFGALPIDADLIESRDGNVISISGGCVCCSYGDDLVSGLMDVGALIPRPDHVLLEASGVALPAGIAASVGLLASYRLDGIAVLADAETILEQYRDTYMGDTVAAQLAAADIVILNKTDLVTSTHLDGCRKWLEGVAPEARILPATQATLPLEALLGIWTERSRSRTAHHDHLAAHRLASVTVSPKGPLDAIALARSLADREMGLLRAKGFVATPDGGMQAIQVVGRRWSVTPAPSGTEAGIVAIGLTGSLDEVGIGARVLQAQSLSRAT